MIPVSSSCISAYDYDPTTMELEITFRSGRTYTYSGVTPDVAAGFAAASSKGSYFNEEIKGSYSASEGAGFPIKPSTLLELLG
jgi:hypothetical protein